MAGERQRGHVVSVVRHGRKFERGSPWRRLGNRKRPNARHEARSRRRKAARKKEQARPEDILKGRREQAAGTEKESNLPLAEVEAKKTRKRKASMGRAC